MHHKTLLPTLLLLTAAASAQQEVTVTADRDNTLYFSASGSLSNGAGSRMFVGWPGIALGERRGVLHFDLAGVVPAGSTVLSARLQLNVETTAILPPFATDHAVHRLLADWGEGTSVAGSGQGTGAPAEPGDATWVHTFFPGMMWGTPGGDFAPTASATYPAPSSGPVSVSSPTLAADVQGWVDMPSSNFGWLARAVTPDAAARVITTREGSLPSLWPSLVVTFDGPLYTAYCTQGAPNSTGASGLLRATGSAAVAANNLTLEASSLPHHATLFFLTSLTQGLVVNPGGSAGDLCLGGNIGRYVGPGQIRNTGSTGVASLLVNLSQHPTPSGLVQVVPGETWNFQAWHRDAVGGVATSNFTHGISVAFH